MPKKSAAELRAELRELRKDKMKPISKMKMGDVSAEIERLRMARETTPAVDAVPSMPPKKMESAVKSVKEAKAAEFPVKPSEAMTKKGPATAKKAVAVPEKKKNMKDKLAKMLAMMSDEESE